MKRVGKTFICLLGGIALTFGAKAITGDPTSIKHGDSAKPSASANTASDSPYGAIVERNIFDLKDPPPPPSAAPETNAPPPNVTLTGIMSILGKKQALFLVQKVAVAGKPADSPESYIMTEGQRQGGLEVLEIFNDKKDPKVKIKNDGVVSTLTFEVSKSPGAGAAMTPQPHMGRPGFNPNMNNPNAGTTPLPTRPLRTPDFSQYSPQGTPNSSGVNPQPNAYNPNGVSGVGYNQGQPQQQALSGDQQVAMFLANQQAHAADIAAGKYPPTPPIPGVTTEPQQPTGQQQSTEQSSAPNNLPSWLQAKVRGSSGGRNFQPPPVP